MENEQDCCDALEVLKRIKRLAEVAIEFHVEQIGEVAMQEIVISGIELESILDEDEEAVEQEDEAFADSEE